GGARWGRGNQRITAWSSTSPPGRSRSRTKRARRGSGTGPANVSTAVRAAGPDTRITAMATGGRPEDSAKIVSRSCVMVNELLFISCSARGGKFSANAGGICVAVRYPATSQEGTDVRSRHVRLDAPQPPRRRNEPVPPPASAQSGLMVAVGPRRRRRGQAHGQTDPALGRLRGLPLVPRHGAREFRG